MNILKHIGLILLGLVFLVVILGLSIVSLFLLLKIHAGVLLQYVWLFVISLIAALLSWIIGKQTIGKYLFK